MGPRILIAEGNDQFAAALEKVMQRRELIVDRVRDGHEALRRIAAAPPALLLLDLRLPKIDGLALLQKLRQSPLARNLPVVVMHGGREDQDRIKAAQDLGVRHLLEKPFRPRELLEALHQVLAIAVAPAQPFARHLQQAFHRRFSGRFLLRNSSGERHLLFLAGAPVALHPGFIHRDFGDFLHRRGLLSAAEYDGFRGGGCREESLVQMGCLDYPRLLQERLDYLHRELVGAFGEPPWTLRVVPFAIPPQLHPVTLNLPEIFHQGLLHHPDQEADRQFLADHGRQHVAVTREFFRHANFLLLEPAEKLFLIRLDGTRTLAACLAGEKELLPLARTLHLLAMIRFAAAPLSPETADFPLRILFNVVEEDPGAAAEEPLESFADLVDVAGGAIDLPLSAGAAVQAAPSSLAKRVRDTLASLEGKNYYEIFGLSQERFSFDRLKESYFALTREFGPDTLMQLSGEEATMVEKILTIVTAAYNTLSEVVKKERYDELLGSEKIGLGQKGDERFQAKVQFQSGKVFLEMEEWDSAGKALQDACNIEPENGLFLAHLAWAIYRNPANISSRAVLEKARQMLNRALTLERSAEAFAFKGRMLLDAGQDVLAETEFNKALKLNARFSLARAGLRQLQEKREQENRGLFRKIFR